jgi:NAD(P)H-hydrate epimerase
MSDRPHSHQLYTVAQVRELDRRAIEEWGVPGYELMRRAAWAALSSLRRHWPQAQRIAVHCGPGNNGGDGFLLALLAREAGLHVDVLALGNASSGDACLARQAWKDGGGVVRLWQLGEALPEVDVHVDAL